MEMIPKPISEEICARCGEPIDVQPGETFTASTDGRVWHYGCAPSRNRPTYNPNERLSEEVEELKHDVERQMSIANAECNEAERLREALERARRGIAALEIGAMPFRDDYLARIDAALSHKEGRE